MYKLILSCYIYLLLRTVHSNLYMYIVRIHANKYMVLVVLAQT